ncbi:unnamed protein product [Adineta steineri]|uniref:Uncharacterized protein n=1 Tax=Adineta steineri TaxID=433720 RepID=A0A819USX7_9BILA|nr:unnamed protein product [Adineta steineri]
MAAQITNLPSLIIGRVLTKSNTTTAIVRVLQMKLDDKFDMFFNQQCRYPLERYEISEIVYELGRIKDPLTGRRCNGLRYLDESFVATDRENQLQRLSPPPLNTTPHE